MEGQWENLDELIESLSLNNNEKILEPVRTESEFNKMVRTEINDRETHYTRLLEMFIDFYEKKQSQKTILKWIFFAGMIMCLAAIIFFSVSIGINAAKFNLEEFSTFVPVIITAAVSFISAIVSIPLVITNYIFDNTEDEKLVDLIGKMQAHDIESVHQMNERD